MTKNQIIILAVLIFYLILNIVIGLVVSNRQSKNSKLGSELNYFIGGRNMTGLILAMTTMATYTSVSSFVSGPGAAAMTYGYAQAWVAAIQVPVTFLTLGVLGNKLALVSRRTGAVTVAGYLKARYKSDILVIVTSLLMVVFFIAQMISQFTGGATLIQSITGLDYKVSLAIFALVVVAYTAIGGFSAVVITDTVQGIIMCIGTFLFIFFILKAGGGLGAIDVSLAQNLPDVYDNLTAVYKPGTLISFWVLVGFGTIALPQTAVRGMGFKSTKELHRAMIIGAVVCTFVIVGMHLAGVWSGALISDAKLPTSDYYLPYIIQKIMPVGVGAIFLAAPMAAVMSTVSSLLILASASIVKDIWRNYIVKDDPVKIERYNKNVKTVSVIVTAIIGIITCILTIDPPDIIFFLNLFAMGGLECSFFWPLVGGLFWKKGTKEAAVVSSVGAAVIYVICYYKVSIAGINAVVWGLLGGAVLYFVTGLITSRKHSLDPDVLEKCF